MCGITGILNLNNKKINNKELEKMTNIVRHRGPDDEGYVLLGDNVFEVRVGKDTVKQIKGRKITDKINKKFTIGLGHRRLSIIDLSANGHQPMSDSEKKIWIVYNGEIYNYIELREELIKKGYKFKTKSDTEVIINAYKEWGTYCVKKFNGMWGFAIYDLKKKLLFCSRDRFGIKPLYYYFDKNVFIFGSEIKSILENKIKIKDSIKLRLRSDVPVGTCLSGGLDSSSIVCLTNELMLSKKIIGNKQKTFKTFSACYETKYCDERKYIEEIIKKTNIEKKYIFPSSKLLWKELQKLIWHQEEPFVGTSVYAQWCVMKLANKKVKVLLDGQGSDELLAGYIYYFYYYLKTLLNRKKYFSFLKEFILSLDLTFPIIKNKFFKTPNFRIEKMLKEKFLENNRKINLTRTTLSDTLEISLTKIGLPALLRYEDKNSMAFSIESRLPFLDYRLVEYISSLPIKLKINNGWTKSILRNSMKDILPIKIRNRRAKLGFSTPENKWLIELKKEIINIFRSKKLEERKYFKQNEILKKFKEFCKNGNNSDIFWRILNLEIWLQTFFQ